ncbi:radical SAM protein [Desulfolithobacter dissulfuricans]|uniref:Radical SAM protein n=1 Tax=Desulfolithobacter dissulfuricans TaxID=2795293 RepID=A0A915XJ94_9BACT|nr:radical SAM protein [Desulfolithobacter dissulfuricans]BCO10045.1 radical SAM protein [Desulfolithobacter dissulfuricans]
MGREHGYTISSLASGGLITNYDCSSRCGHCLYRCSPFRSREYISDDRASAAFAVARSLGCRSMHIGGGEPLLRPGRLEKILMIARREGVGIDYVETNSSWFRDLEQACGLLERLKEAGLRTLLVSISPFHNEFIPLARTMGVLEACHRTGIAVFPWQKQFLPELGRFDTEKTVKLGLLEEHFGAGYVAGLMERYGIRAGGRALETFRPHLPRLPLEEILRKGGSGCREPGDTTHFHLDLLGNYIPGLCSGLALDWRDLGQPVDPEKYPVLTRLALEGLASLYRWAGEVYGFSPSRTSYWSKCELCTEIRQYLACRSPEGFPDLQPREFYLEPEPKKAGR